MSVPLLIVKRLLHAISQTHVAATGDNFYVAHRSGIRNVDHKAVEGGAQQRLFSISRIDAVQERYETVAMARTSERAQRHHQRNRSPHHWVRRAKADFGR